MSSLWARIKEFFLNMLGINHKIEETLHVTPAVSDRMSEAIDEWTAMYMDEAEWLQEPSTDDPSRVVSLGLPAFIASEKARMAVLEFKSEITAPTKTERKPNPNYFPPVSDEFGNVRVSGESPTVVEEVVEGDTRRADYLNEQYHKKLLSKIRTQLEYGTAKGSLIIKPYVVRSKVQGVAGIENKEKQPQNNSNQNNPAQNNPKGNPNGNEEKPAKSKWFGKKKPENNEEENSPENNQQGGFQGNNQDKQQNPVQNNANNNENIENANAGGKQGEQETYKYKMEYDFIQSDCFYPISFDGSGNLTDVAFIQTKVEGDITYTRLERHKLNVNNVTIENYAFKQTASGRQDIYTGIGGMTLGSEIPLTDVPEWKDIPKKAVIQNVDRLLFGYFKMPDANTIDPHSPLGMSCFGRARNLIKDADEQYSRLLWEFEGGELAIDIDRDALQFMADAQGNGHSAMGHLQNRLYRTIDLGESDTYKPFSPSLRDQSLINGLNTILMRIEDVCALSRGTISDVAAEARTATEIKILKQRSFSANKEIQCALQTALEDVIYAMNVYVTLYNIVGDLTYRPDGTVDTSQMGTYDVSFEWDDSILVDEDTELQTRMSLHQAGIESKLAIRQWYFGETELQAQEALNKVTQENKEAIEQNMVMSSQLGSQVRNGEEPAGDQPNAKKGKKDKQNPQQKQLINPKAGATSEEENNEQTEQESDKV